MENLNPENVVSENSAPVVPPSPVFESTEPISATPQAPITSTPPPPPVTSAPMVSESSAQPAASGANPAPASAAPSADALQDVKAQLAQLNNTADYTSEMDPKDIEENKAMGILAYFGIFVLIPLIAKSDSPFSKFHANQGIMVWLISIVLGVGAAIFSAILFAISEKLAFLAIFANFIYILPTIFAVLGIVNAASGKAKELPFIGKYRLFK